MDPIALMDKARGKTPEQLEKEKAEGENEGVISRFVFDKTSRGKAAAGELEGRKAAQKLKDAAEAEKQRKAAVSADFKFAKGGAVRGDGAAQRGKTRGRFV